MDRNIDSIANLSVIICIFGFAIICIVLLISYFRANSSSNKIEATKNARKFVTQMQISAQEIECMTAADQDGYVNCTVAFLNNTGKIELTALKCRGTLNISDTCFLVPTSN